MKQSLSRLGILLVLPLSLAGCGGGVPAKQQARIKIEKSLALLSPEDRRLAEQQGFCAVETENQLGSMGKPYKLMVKGEPVFLCCKGCEKAALKDPDATLAKVKKLRAPKAKTKIEKSLALLSPEERRLAEQQGFCAVETENQLGSMGKPYKLMVKGQPVFLCCKGCQEEALKNPDATLAKVKKLRAQTAATGTK